MKWSPAAGPNTKHDVGAALKTTSSLLLAMIAFLLSPQAGPAALAELICWLGVGLIVH